MEISYVEVCQYYNSSHTIVHHIVAGILGSIPGGRHCASA